MHNLQSAVGAWREIIDSIEGVTYLTDPAAIVVAAGMPNWNRFAAENQARKLMAGEVTGNSIFDFIAGDDVRQSYRNICDSVLEARRARVVFDYRCDSADFARELRNVDFPGQALRVHCRVAASISAAE